MPHFTKFKPEHDLAPAAFLSGLQRWLGDAVEHGLRYVGFSQTLWAMLCALSLGGTFAFTSNKSIQSLWKRICQSVSAKSKAQQPHP